MSVSVLAPAPSVINSSPFLPPPLTGFDDGGGDFNNNFNGNRFPSSMTFQYLTLATSVILFVVFIFIATLNIYARCYRSALSGNYRSNRNGGGAQSSSMGFDKATIEQHLPSYTFKAHVPNPNPNSVTVINDEDKQNDELSNCCSICLGNFQDSEMCRNLPACKHSFHMDCIDMWLLSHTTCPLCRSPAIANLNSSSDNPNNCSNVREINSNTNDTNPVVIINVNATDPISVNSSTPLNAHASQEFIAVDLRH